MPSQRVGISEPSPVRIPLATRKKNHFFERESDSYPLCGRWSEGQASKRNKWREARREAPFMPDCDLDRSGTFCLLNPPTDQHKKQTLSCPFFSGEVHPLRHSFTAPVNEVVVRRRLVNETCAATRCSGLKPSGRLCAAKKLRTNNAAAVSNTHDRATCPITKIRCVLCRSRPACRYD
jgi:hypothetical protein